MIFDYNSLVDAQFVSPNCEFERAWPQFQFLWHSLRKRQRIDAAMWEFELLRDASSLAMRPESPVLSVKLSL
jgi:hypothetical protein